jgi:hypothetical protein
MNDIAEQRPSFFEGEVLSAADLEHVVVYLRDQNARHLLGGHTWGIVAGLQLLEQTAPNGAIDYYLLPGYAVDGYGRAIVVVNPLRLSVDWFNGQPSGPVQVWIRYDQDQTNAVRQGFQVCCGDNDAYSRVAESYAIEVGNKSLPKQQSGISIAGEAVDDARTALRTFNDAGQVVCDGSVPYQDLPLVDESKKVWLIPLGEVGWKAGTPGELQTLVDEDNPSMVIHSRRLRRYVGVVAENVYAADGLIRLRRRTTSVASADGTPVDPAVIDDACAAGDLTDASHDDDLENCPDGVLPSELVWVEGRMRCLDDVRILAPGRLELRDKDGTSYYPDTTKGSSATFLQRTDHVEGTSNNADLSIVVSKAKTGNNRVLIQQATTPKEPEPCQAVQFDALTSLVTVLDDGKVGIGTETPDQLLTIEDAANPAFIHLKDTAAPSELYVGADANGGVLVTVNSNDLRFRTGGTDPTKDEQTRMTIISTGEVGIGTTTPDTNHQVTIQHESRASLLLRTEDDAHEAVLKVNDDGAMLTANKADDDLRLGADTGKPYIWVKASGRIGINEDSPSHDVGITNTGAKCEIAMRSTGGGATRHMEIGTEDNNVHAGSTTDHPFHLRTNDTTQMTITNAGRVGIGTQSPSHKLDVRGNIALGSNGQFFAPGGYQNWAVVAGLVDGNSGSSSGVGWNSFHVGSLYTVNFVDAPFASPPIVTVQLTGIPVVGVPIPIVNVSSTGGFQVTMWGFGIINYSFYFIALAER